MPGTPNPQPSSMHVRPFICTASAPRNARSTKTAAARQSTVPAHAAPEKTGSRSSGESLRSKFSGATPSQRTVSCDWQIALPKASVASMPSTVMWSSSEPCTVLETSMPRQLILLLCSCSAVWVICSCAVVLLGGSALLISAVNWSKSNESQDCKRAARPACGTPSKSSGS